MCAVKEVKILCTIILRRIRPYLDPHIPASLWRAISGRSAHEVILLQDTVAHMEPIELIIVSLDVKGADPNTPLLPLEAVRKRLGLPFTYDLAAVFSQNLKSQQKGFFRVD